MTATTFKTSKGQRYTAEFYPDYDGKDNAPVRFDAFDKTDESVINNLTLAEAHEIADWIKANVPEPSKVPTIREQVDNLATGTQFTVPDSGGAIYTKLTKGKIWSSWDGGTLVDMDTHAMSWSRTQAEIAIVSAA